ncbi:hypothetical protein L1987_21008 [Smallanthus sonchifolius]|uniref:Uncharacterized protein n=1 Tax=Smallanthus sonchifolius TaxID=185202 RepID=A0ACB9IW98_9ASTR|nr:hypothetical protein L1987_21008 [Smallanthus sonchifolius]
MDRLRIRERLKIKGRGFGKGRFKGLTVSVNNASAGEMDDVSLEFQKLDDLKEKKKEIEIEIAGIYNKNIERSKVVSLIERFELLLQVIPVWSEDISVNEIEMEDNNIEKLDIQVDNSKQHLEYDDNIDINHDNIDINQGIQSETTEKGYADHFKDNNRFAGFADGPSYSIGLTQDGLSLTADEHLQTGQYWRFMFHKLEKLSIGVRHYAVEKRSLAVFDGFSAKFSSEFKMRQFLPQPLF